MASPIAPTCTCLLKFACPHARAVVASDPTPTPVAVDLDPAPVTAKKRRGRYSPWAARAEAAGVDIDADTRLAAARSRAAAEAAAAAANAEAEERTRLLEDLVVAAEDPERAAALRRAMDAAIAREDFAEFCRQAWSHSGDAARLEWNWHHQLICDVLQSLYETWRRGQADPEYVVPVLNTVFNLPPGSLKPVADRSRVQERHRGAIRADEVRVGDFLLTHRGRYRRVEAVAEHGVLPVLRVRTHRGRELFLNDEHPVLTQRGWVRADALRLSDVLASVHSSETSGSSSIPVEEARLIGYLIGDGCLRLGQASFTNQDPETIEDFMACARAVGLDARVRALPPSVRALGKATRVVGLIGGTSLSVREWLTRHDLIDRPSGSKAVPRAVLGGDEFIIAEYLAAYWACDGGIHDRRDLPRAGRVGQTSKTIRVDATTVSADLARDHLYLLQRLGLEFSLRRKSTKLTAAMCGASGKRVGEDYSSFHIVAADQDTVAKFLQIVGPSIRHEKRSRVEGLERTEFDRVLHADPIIAIDRAEPEACRCFQIAEDSSFACEGLAVHNSRLISVFFMCWVWLESPGAKFICLSVNEDATFRDARMTRDLLRSGWYRSSFAPEWTLKVDQDAVGDFANSVGGGRLSKPSGSEIVGLRADFLMIDDPNNPKEAENKKTRDEVNEVWNTNIYNRVNDLSRSLRIGVQQRTHGMDWTGYVLARQGAWSSDNRMGWLHVVLPVEFEPARAFRMPDALAEALRARVAEGRVVADPRVESGESLHPSRFSKEVIAAERRRGEGTNYFAGQMQQRPALATGGAIERKWLNFCRLDGGVRPEFDALGGGRPRPSMCHSEPAMLIPAATHRPGFWDLEWLELHVDPANQKTSSGSNWGMLMMGGYKGRRLVLDDRSRRGDILEIVATMCEMLRMWRPDKVVMERKAAWESLQKMLIAEMMAGTTQMITIDAIDPGPLGKEDRLTSAKPTISNGLLYILDGAAWAEEFVEELCTFPAAPNDDRVDAVVQALNLHLVSGDSDEWPDL